MLGLLVGTSCFGGPSQWQNKR